MCTHSRPRSSGVFQLRASRCHGLTLIELIIFIMIVSVALLGTLLAMNTTVRKSSDPLVQKQALAVAEGLLEEVELMPFTYCDPDDANVTTARTATVNASDPTQCQSSVEGLGPEAGESRYSTAQPFDNVSDYHGFDTNTATPSGVRDVSGTLSGLPAYRAAVQVVAVSLGNASFTTTAAYLITVTVTAPGGTQVALQGYRTRYAPRSP